MSQPESSRRDRATEAGGCSPALPNEPTPDDGTRLTNHDLWNESDRPTGPKAPAGTIFSRQGVAVSNHLIEVHNMLRAELGRLRDVVTQVEIGRATVGEARATINELTMASHNWALGAYCANFCRVVTGHHGLEDTAIFPHLRQSDPSLVPVVDRLGAEHLVIHGVVESIDQTLVAYLGGAADMSQVRAAVDLLTDTLTSHLSYEEREILDPLARFGFYRGQV